MINSLEDLALILYGITKNEAHRLGICIKCKLPPEFKTDISHREWYISGLCESCFNSITREK